MLTPYQLLDGIYYRLKKPIPKKEIGMYMPACKALLDMYRRNNVQDYEIVQLLEYVCTAVKSRQLPQTFRYVYGILRNAIQTRAMSKVTSEAVPQNLKVWIEQEIVRLSS
jgi:hypothetical protein